MDKNTLDWDLEDRNARLESGELYEDIPDPTEIVVDADA